MNNRLAEFWLKLRWKLYLPEYLYRPSQILTRIRRKTSAHSNYEVAQLPWGSLLRIRLPELISNSIWFKGLFDIVSTETIWRLLDEGDTALDVGANIGYMTSLMAARVGKNGKVISFEPHPELFEELGRNVQLWRDSSEGATIEVRNSALSAKGGAAKLVMPPSWKGNRGAGFVSSQSTDVESENSLEIKLECLDDIFPDDRRIELAKFDVEGHEFEAFRGAERLLSLRMIRDIVFEDSMDTESPAKLELKRHGYTLFSLAKRFRGPKLCSVDRKGASPRDDPNFLATSDPDRAVRRLSSRGWEVLRRRGSGSD